MRTRAHWPYSGPSQDRVFLRSAASVLAPFVQNQHSRANGASFRPETGVLSMDTLITLQEASQQYSIPLPDLRQMARDGKIWSAKFNGEVMVAMDNSGTLRANGLDQEAQEDVLRVQFRHLEGVPIRLNEAARKYRLLTNASLSRWAKAGYIRILATDTQTIYLDEADVAYAAARIKLQGGPRPGKAVFQRRRNHQADRISSG